MGYALPALLNGESMRSDGVRKESEKVTTSSGQHEEMPHEVVIMLRMIVRKRSEIILGVYKQKLLEKRAKCPLIRYQRNR